MTADSAQFDDAFVQSVIQGSSLADVRMLRFRDPRKFVAGELHRHPEFWAKLSASAPDYPQASEVLHWIRHKVDVNDYFAPFKGSYKNQNYDCATPPPRIFSNHPSCKPFVEFISRTILDRLRSGAISLWGKVGRVPPPHLVLPLTVEPSKPRLCNDDRFLNLWMVNRPFRLDTLKDLPRYVDPDHYQSVCDDKSGYDHIMLSESSRTYFGFQWGGWLFVSTCIPFGWKLSAYIYHSIGSLVSHFLRTQNIPCSLYIDDRHIGQLHFPSGSSPSAYRSLSVQQSNLAASKAAIFVTYHTLISLGYTIGLSKSILEPNHQVPYLGFTVDSHLQAFTLLPSKKQKFLLQLKSVLANSQVELITLQKLAGKCLSMALAVPGARLFTNEINMAISRASLSSRPAKVEGGLRKELEQWLFLESWDGSLPWRLEHHRQIRLFSDASSYAWGGCLGQGPIYVSTSDYWDASTQRHGIVVKETLALANVLLAFGPKVRNSWVDVFTDNQALVKAWQSQGARSPAFSTALKAVFSAMCGLNVDLHLFYIPSANNLADSPSRRLTLQDAQLCSALWEYIQEKFGGTQGHSVDLMALPSNCQTDLKGQALPFFSPFPTPRCSGVNLFAQSPQTSTAYLFDNPYVFPPICLIPQVLRFLKSLHIPFTMVIPDILPRRFWWSLLCSACETRLLLAPAGSAGALAVPSKEGYRQDWSLPWDLWVFRISPK